MRSHQPTGITRRHALGLGIGALFAARSLAASSQEQREYTFAFLGLDTRDNDSDQRSDTIMLSRVDLDAHTVRTLSIPRDLYVEIPGYGFSKINDAYQRGLASDPELKWQSGVAVAVETLSHSFGVGIDGTVVLELQRLPEVINALGGVEVYNPYHVYVEEFPNYRGHGTRTLDFPSGLITLDGQATKDFVRTRQQDGDGGRVMRQHLVLTALLEMLQQSEFLIRVPALVAQFSDVVHTDIALDVQLQLIEALPSISQENLAFTNIEALLWSGYTEGGAWIYQADWATLPGYVRAWLDGEVD